MVKNGFTLYNKNVTYFFISNNKNVTDKIAIAFIRKICEIKGVQNIFEKASHDRETVKCFKLRIKNATLKKRNGFYYINGKNFGEVIPKTDKDFIIF